MTRFEKLQRMVREGRLEVEFGGLDSGKGWVEVRSTLTGKRTTVNKEHK